MHRGVGVLAAWLVLCAIAAPAQRATPPSRTLIDAIRERMDPVGALAWSSKRPLTWDDFQGAPILTSDEGAHTAYSLFSAARCVQSRFEFVAIAAILPRQSWVRPAVVAEASLNKASLQHEQTHFDLTESYARRMRKYFGELYDPCSKAESELDAQADRYVAAEAEMQRRYDEETANGRVAAKQADWNAEVARQLVSLGRWASDR